MAASQPQWADLKTLASSLYDLSVTAAAPPPPPPPAPIEPRSAPPPMVPVPGRVYSVGDAGVVPPVAVRQTLPPFPASNDMGPSQANLEVVIDEHGAVESAVMRSPLSDVYDRQVIAAARRWQFKPATLGGVPVKFRKTIQISLKR
jgi:TonB family protein